MTARLTFPALCLLLVLTGANAQDTTTAPASQTPATSTAQPKAAAGEEAKPPAREAPPDMKALNEAEKITDPAKRVEALEKLKKDFPNSTASSIADGLILNTLAKMPNQSAKVRQLANAMYKEATRKDKENAK